MAIQDDNTILSKQDLKEYHNRILPYLGGNMMMSTNNSDYYSTDEKVVGVWTDGKPLYQKTFVTTTASNSSEKAVYDTTGLNIVRVSQFRLEWQDGSDRGYVWDSRANGTSTSIDFYTRGNTLYIQIGDSAFYGREFIATIQYTKTTDTASTALTTPGAYDINFPNTWPANKEIFFGNGLYGRRCTGNLPATAVNSACTVDLFNSQSSSTKIVNMGGSFNVLGVHDNSYSLGYLTQDTSPFNLITNAVLFYSSSKVMRLRIATGPYTNLTTNNTYDVWVTYTK